MACGVGSSCPGSDALSVLPGYHSKSDEPGILLACFGNPERCPGGGSLLGLGLPGKAW